MTRSRYQQLKPESVGPGVCPTHRLLNYEEVAARIDAEKLRNESELGSPGSAAEARKCSHSSAWHIFIPTKGRMKTLRKKERSRRSGKETP